MERDVTVMKRFLPALACLTVAAALALCLAGCQSSTPEPSTVNSAPTQTYSGPSTAPEPSPAPSATKPAPEPSPAPEPDSGDDIFLTNGALRLRIPREYAELLVTETPQDGTTLFQASEKASVEAGEKLHPGEDWGDGLLFSIGVLSESELQEQLCYDMSGAEVFARDASGHYYMLYTPTDVRFVRESYETIPDPNSPDLAQWSELNDWAATVRETFLADNPSLSPEHRGNTDVDMYLARLAYTDDLRYTLSTTALGPLEPGNVDRKPYLERLMTGVMFEWTDESEAPDGEYVVLGFPDENMRLDFFTGDNTYVRQVYGSYGNGSFGYETLYRISLDPGAEAPVDVLQEWYAALAADRGLSLDAVG